MKKIAYVTPYDARDINSWSGTALHIGREMARQGYEVEFMGPLATCEYAYLRLRDRFYTQVLRKKYIAEIDGRALRAHGVDASAKVARSGANYVLAPQTTGVAYLETKLPLALWVDCTFDSMVNFYPDYCNLCGASLRDGNRMEELAFGRCTLGIFASDWAARSAIKRYGLAPGRTAVVPFGANIVCNRTEADIEAYLAGRPATTCNLLFIGKIWERKGGNLAMEVAKKLNEAGLPTTLTLVGSRPPGEEPLPGYVKAMGFINKATEEGKRQIDSLIAGSHFLIVPSRAEAYGIVFCEASSFGVPSLGTDVGGIPTVVRDGRNGKTFALAAGADEYCRHVLEFFGNWRAYQDLARASFNEYQTRLNWTAAGASVKKLLAQL